MSLENEQIKQEFERFSSRFGPKTIVPARVLEVNNDDTIVIEFSDESVIDDCRLKSVVKDGNKVLLIPAVDSVVLVAQIENSGEYVVIAVDEVTEVLVEIEGVKYNVSEDGFLFQKGTDTLWDAVKLLIESLEKVVILQGTNIDLVKLQQAKLKFKNILNGA